MALQFSVSTDNQWDANALIQLALLMDDDNEPVDSDLAEAIAFLMEILIDRIRWSANRDHPWFGMDAGIRGWELATRKMNEATERLTAEIMRRKEWESSLASQEAPATPKLGP